MGVDGHAAGDAVQHRIVERYIQLSSGIGALVTAVEQLPVFRAAEHSPGAVVQLQAAAAGIVQGTDKVGIGLDQILEKLLLIGVDGCQRFGIAGTALFAVKLGRCRNGQPGDGPTVHQLLQEAKMLQERVIGKADPAGDPGGVGPGLLAVE